jgi:hypothetical protein
MYEKSTLNLLLSPPLFMQLPVPYAAHDGQNKWSTVSSVIVLINYLDVIQEEVWIPHRTIVDDNRLTTVML